MTQRDPDLAEVKQLLLQLQESVDALALQLRQPQSRGRRGPAHSMRPPCVPLLAFVHIPKTAGGTMKAILAGAYSREGVLDAGNYPRSPGRTERKLARKAQTDRRMLIGHVPLAVFRRHLPGDTAYVTLVRDPVERVLSHYYRHVHRPDGKPGAQTPGKRRLSAVSLEQALEEQRLPELCDLATRFLCDAEHPLEELPEGALEDAKRNLADFAFVGLQERFDESSVMLARSLGFTLQGHRHRHVSGERPTAGSISTEERELIESANALDIELYRWAAERFERVLAEDPEIEDEVGRLRAAGTLRAPVRPV